MANFIVVSSQEIATATQPSATTTRISHELLRQNRSLGKKKKNYNSLKAHMMVSICLNQTIFKVCLFFDIVLLYTKDYSINIILYILRRKKKVLRLKILTLLQWSGTEPTIPPRFACIYLSCRCMHAQSYLTLCDPMNCSPPGSSVHGILQARILEWVAIPLSGVSSPPRDQTWVSQVADRFFTI